MRAAIPDDGPQQFTYALGFRDGGVMAFDRGRYRAAQVTGGVTLCAPGGHGIPEHLSAVPLLGWALPRHK